MKQMKKVAEPSAESPPPPPPGAIPRRGSYNKGKSTTKKDKATPKKSASQPKPRPQKRKSSKQTSKDDANSVDLCDSEAEGEDRTDWDADVPDRAPKRSQSEVSVAQQIAQLTPHRGSAPDNMMAPQPM